MMISCNDELVSMVMEWWKTRTKEHMWWVKTKTNWTWLWHWELSKPEVTVSRNPNSIKWQKWTKWTNMVWFMIPGCIMSHICRLILFKRFASSTFCLKIGIRHTSIRWKWKSCSLSSRLKPEGRAAVGNTLFRWSALDILLTIKPHSHSTLIPENCYKIARVPSVWTQTRTGIDSGIWT